MTRRRLSRGCCGCRHGTWRPRCPGTRRRNLVAALQIGIGVAVLAAALDVGIDVVADVVVVAVAAGVVVVVVVFVVVVGVVSVVVVVAQVRFVVLVIFQLSFQNSPSLLKKKEVYVRLD